MVAFLILLLFAVIFVVAGVVLLYFRNRTKRKSALMSQTETSNASEVGGIAPGTLVEVKGTLRCEEPLTSEMAERTCAYYSSTVTREYLRPDYDDDDNDVGSDRRTEIIAQNVQFAPFMVEDDTGLVGVHAEGAEIDARQVVNRFDRNTGNEGTFSLGGITVNLGGGERTIGYRYTESILPVDESIYVLGAVQEGGVIGAPHADEKDHRFVVSHRSEEAHTQSLGKTALWLGVGGAASLVVGVVLLVVGILILAS
jgi:E3 ubiquitin ligase